MDDVNHKNKADDERKSISLANNKRIAKNTLFLYFRMLLIMAVTLYTSRIYLHVLGETDFGIYNIVGGVIVLLSFVSNTLATSTQRFLNYEMGKGEAKEVGKVFSSSMVIYLLFSLSFLFVGETVGLWFLNTQMNIPAERMFAANWVYQFSLLGFVANMLRVPYYATIIATERMSFYAYFSIFEAILKLSVAFILLKWGNVDKLINLSILTFVVFVIVTLFYKWYCNRYFIFSRFHIIWDKSIMRRLLSFSGWSLLGSSANMGATQGGNIIINIFCGVTVNAAVGVATQLIHGINQLVSNFQMAYSPQLVKLYASGQQKDFMNLIFSSSKFSYLLLLMIAIPSMICMDFILKVWLGTPPEYTADFCNLIMMYLLLDAVAAPLYLSVQAVGKIKNYQILVSSIIVMNLPLTYLALRSGISPLSVWVIRVVINTVVYFVRIYYLKGLIKLPVVSYLKTVMFPLLIVTLLAFPIPYLLNGYYDAWINLLVVAMTSSVLILLLVYVFGLNKEEKYFVKAIIKKHIIQ